ncbi:MAG: hypothetical protein HGA62_02810 [Chlorobiaceae bacterium]|nr:hypothetical protein [Chlorobiaceae bacterium]NTV61186.1 hypothetical protein [Chlorobiaceae bacterium]
MSNKVHPDEVLDDFEVIDEPNFNNFNTSPEPPSPYADLEKKYRKNRFNKNRNKKPSDLFGVNGVTLQPEAKGANGNKLQKRKPKKKTFSKSSGTPPGRRNP